MTAVEWLLEHDYLIRTTNWKDIVEQALEMEKEQIINALGVGCQIKPKGLMGYYEMGEEYYNETYGKSKTPPGAHCQEA